MKEWTEQSVEFERDYRAFMQSMSIDEFPVAMRIRELASSIADPCCPLNYYAKNVLAVNDAAYLCGVSKTPKTKSDTFSRELFLLSGPLGLFDTSGTRKLQLPVPGDDERIEINELRFGMERDALVEVHNMPNNDKRKGIVLALKRANSKAMAALSVYDNMSEEELEDKLAVDPEVGHDAMQFWEADATFHTIALDKTDKRIAVELNRTLLVRIRLSHSNRAKVIKRISASVKEHTAIIKAVKKEPATASAEIEQRLRDHFNNSNSLYKLVLKDVESPQAS